jgi:RNA polymerase sigma-70 factor, ECF subfamily
MPTDETLIQRIVKKDVLAFELLYDRYSSRMFRYFYRMLWQREDLANDYTQDLFLKIIEKPHLFDPKKRFSTWIYTVAANMCKNAYRAHQPTEDLAQQVFSYEEQFELTLDLAVQEAQLQAAINTLHAEHRQCIVLRFFETLSIKEMAQILELPEGTIKSRIHYALRALKPILQP